MSACDAVYLISQNFLNFEAAASLAQQLSYLAINTDVLKAQGFVAEEMVKSDKVIMTPSKSAVQPCLH